MATIRPTRSFEISENLDTIAGVTLAWRLSSDPVVPAETFENERKARGLGKEYRCPGLTAKALFARECRAATRNYPGGEGRTHKITALPPHKDSDAWTNSFVIGRKGSAAGARATHIGRVRLDLATERITWEFDSFARCNWRAETDAEYIERFLRAAPSFITPVDVRQFVYLVNHIESKLVRFTNCVDVHQYRETITRVLRSLSTFQISHGSWFVPNDVRAGSANPVLVVERLKDLIEAVNPANRVYLIPVFPSADAISAAADGAADSIDAKIIELSDKLDAIAEFSHGNSGEKWAAKWARVESEAALYHRLLGMQQRDFAERIEKARQAVEEKAEALAQAREAAEADKLSQREQKRAERAAKRAALEATPEPVQMVVESSGNVETIPSRETVISFARRVRSRGRAEMQVTGSLWLLGWTEGASVLITIKREDTGAKFTTPPTESPDWAAWLAVDMMQKNAAILV